MKEVRAKAMQLSRGREFQAEGAASAKALRWEHAARFEGLPGGHRGSGRGARRKSRGIEVRKGTGRGWILEVPIGHCNDFGF